MCTRFENIAVTTEEVDELEILKSLGTVLQS